MIGITDGLGTIYTEDAVGNSYNLPQYVVLENSAGCPKVLPVLKFNVDDNKTLKYQLRATDRVTPVDITGLTFTWFARDKAGDAAYTIGPVVATITDAVNGLFEFDVDMPSDPTNSLYWMERHGALGDTDTFAPAEGTKIQVMAK